MCWLQLPRHLRTALAIELAHCNAARIEHSQELLALRDEAIDYLSRMSRKRLEHHCGQQLRLLPQ